MDIEQPENAEKKKWFDKFALTESSEAVTESKDITMGVGEKRSRI